MAYICNGCTDPCVIDAGDSDGVNGGSSSRVLLDDIELICGHHFHWSCFTDAYSDGHKSTCPHCDANILDSVGQLIVTMRNEGGEQPGFNLGQMLAEEEFYESNPELLRVRAFLEFCANGEKEDLEEMLETDAELVAAQDFETGQTCLHVACQRNREDREDIVMFLLGKGADRNATDNSGRTFIDFAKELGASEEILARLASS